MKFDPKISLSDNLVAARTADRRVTVHLANGAQLSGRVGDVGDHQVVIEALAQREFFDALVPLAHILALEVQTRTS